MSGVSIKWKLLMPVIFIFIMTLAQIFLIMNMVQAQKADAVRINLSGRQRALSQKMTKETFNYMMNQDGQMAQEQAATMDTFEKSLNTLIGGGTIDLGGRQTLVKPADKKEILADLHEAKEYWNQAKPVFEAALAKPDQAKVTEINDLSIGLFQRFDKITAMYERAGDDMVKRNMTFIFSVLFLYILLTAAAWCYLQRNFVQPILSIRDTANKIAAGDLTLGKGG